MTTPPATVLIADDEESIRLVLTRALEGGGFRCIAADNGTAALDSLLSRAVNLAFLDIRMPGSDGLTVLRRLREEGVDIPVIVMTAQNTMANAIEAMKNGAYDYLTKPFDIEAAAVLARRALEVHRLASDMRRLETEMRRRFELGVELVGCSGPMQEIYKTIGRIAPTDVTVMLEGESGTGKELIAKAIHYHSRRWSGPFVALNCSAVPRDLLESELFGHERGAFTGAVERRAGRFESAAGGTLFLDEIGDMPVELQAKLLRVLQEREFVRVGGQEVIRSDCRVIAATNQDLKRAIAESRFREDLYFRLNVVPIRVPPLRERTEDIPDLIVHFVAKANRELGTQIAGISREAQDRLIAQPWPGNVRELENAIVRAAVLAPSRTLTASDFSLAPPPAARPDDGGSLDDLLRSRLADHVRPAIARKTGNLRDAVVALVERPLIEIALAETGGNQLQAAALLGINRNTLRKKITQLKITLKASGTEFRRERS